MSKAMSGEEVQAAVVRALLFRFGRAKALPGYQIAENIGLGTSEKGVATVRKAVRGLRRKGRLIVAAVTQDDQGNEPGYFFAASADEYRRYMGPFRHRAMDILATIRPMEEAAAVMWGHKGRLDQVGVGQLEMQLGDPDAELANAGGPRWWEVE